MNLKTGSTGWGNLRKGFFLFASLLFVAFQQAWAGGVGNSPVRATGVAELKDGNLAGARRAALEDALRQAVEQGVGMLMHSVSALKDDRLMERIYADVHGCIGSYRIIDEKVSGGLCTVTVEAEVKEDVLRDALSRLGLIKAMMDFPRVMILPGPGAKRSQAAEAAITRELVRNRFDVVESGAFPTQALNGGGAKTGMNSAAARAGCEHDAELVILYWLESEEAWNDGIMETVPVTFRARAVETTTGQILDAWQSVVNGLGETPALAARDGAARAASRGAKEMSRAIAAWWADYTANGIPYVIILSTGKGTGQDCTGFVRALEAVAGVVSVTERRSDRGITEIMVRFKGGAGELKHEVLEVAAEEAGLASLHLVRSRGRFMVFEQ